MFVPKNEKVNTTKYYAYIVVCFGKFQNQLTELRDIRDKIKGCGKWCCINTNTYLIYTSKYTDTNKIYSFLGSSIKDTDIFIFNITNIDKDNLVFNCAASEIANWINTLIL